MRLNRKNDSINDAVEVLDNIFLECNMDTQEAWARLSQDSLEFIDGELYKCKIDPRYYMENYHTIMTEDQGIKTLYPFWDSQEMFYAEIVTIQLSGRAVKLIVLKARQLGSCLHPDTKVLTADLRWIPISEVECGQELVAVDEGQTEEEQRAYWAQYQREWKQGKKRGVNHRRKVARKLRTAVVQARRDVFKKAYRLTMENGEILIATGEHRFLSKQRTAVSTQWRTVEKMVVGDVIRFVVHPWEQGLSYEDGWFSGVIDGEGTIRAKHRGGSEACVSQVENGVLDRARKYLTDRQYNYREEVDTRKGGESSKLGNKPVVKLVLNSIDQIFKLVGQTRPARFTSNHSWWEGKELPGKGGSKTCVPWLKIVSIEELPAQRMIDLQTSEKTFIAEGFVSHNSTISEGLVFHKTIFTEGVNTLIIAQDPVTADHQFSMSRTAYDNLPWWMRPEERYQAKGRYLVFDRKDDVERRINPGLKSKIIVEASNKMTSPGRGQTFRSAHLSELASWGDGGVLSQSIFPTMNARDGLYIMESTAEGRVGFWYHFWRDTIEGKTDWHPLFIPYYKVKKYSRPIKKGEIFTLTKEEKSIREKIEKRDNFTISDETFNWARMKTQEFISLEGDEFRFYQEYPLGWQEAFQGTGLCAFNKRKLQNIMDTTCSPPKYFGEIYYHMELPVQSRIKLKVKELKPGMRLPPAKYEGERLRIWEMPEPDAVYFIGVDVAHGVEGGDFSCAQVIKIGAGPEPDEQVAEWRGWINPTPWAYVVAALGYMYNGAQIAVECNDVGLTTNNELFRIIEYDNIYRWKHFDKVKNFYTDFLGWFTNSKTRDLIIAKCREAIQDDTLIIRSEDCVDEMMDFSSDGGRFEGQDTNDDRVMALQIARFCAHDSDFGKEAASRPSSGRFKEEVLLVFDEKNRLRYKLNTKENSSARDDAELIVKNNAGWSMRTMGTGRDFNNTDFSPIHDKPGSVRSRLHYEDGIPEDKITDELVLYAQMATAPSHEDEGGDWRSI